MSEPRKTFDAAAQDLFARELRERLPVPRGQYEHHIHALTTYSGRVLGQPKLLHFRGLTVEEAREVIKVARREYPERKPYPPPKPDDWR